MRPIPVYCSVETAEKRSVHTERTEGRFRERERRQRERVRDSESRERRAEEKRESKEREELESSFFFLPPTLHVVDG